MKRFVLSVVVSFCVLFTCIFTGCSSGNKNYEEYTPKEGSKFFQVEQYVDPHLGTVTILVDRDTRIIYMLIEYLDGNASRIAFSVLYDSNGMPKKYSGVINN